MVTNSRLLPKSELAAFIEWLDAVGIQHREGGSPHEVLQVRAREDRVQWCGVYLSDAHPDHLLVAEGLGHIMRRFRYYLTQPSGGGHVRVEP